MGDNSFKQHEKMDDTAKTEKEKMAAGEFYSPADEILYNENRRAKDLTAKYNNTSPRATNERQELLRAILGHAGKNVCMEAPFQCDYGYNIFVGDNFYANVNCVFLDCAPIRFGDNVLVGPNTGFYTPQHPIHPEDRKKGIERALPITIGDNVWIGGSVTILGGVSIGDNSIIGAGSVVTRDIPANVIAVGNPCRVIRSISENDKLESK